MVTSARLLINGFLFSRHVCFIINFYFVLGFILAVIWFRSSVTIFKEVCWVCVFATWVRLSPQPSRFVSSIYLQSHIFIHAYIHLYTHIHTLTHSHKLHKHTCIHTHIHAHTYIRKSYIHNCVSYSESWFNKKNKQNDEMSSPVRLTQRYQQVYNSSNRFHKPSAYEYTSLFPQCFLKSYLSNTTFTAFSCVLLSNNDSKHQHYIYRFLLVSCSPTMTANTNTTFTAFSCVLLSNNDSKHQHYIYLYPFFQTSFSHWTFVPSQVIVTSCIHDTALNIAFIALYSQYGLKMVYSDI